MAVQVLVNWLGEVPAPTISIVNATDCSDYNRDGWGQEQHPFDKKYERLGLGVFYCGTYFPILQQCLYNIT